MKLQAEVRTTFLGEEKKHQGANEGKQDHFGDEAGAHSQNKHFCNLHLTDAQSIDRRRGRFYNGSYQKFCRFLED